MDCEIEVTPSTDGLQATVRTLRHQVVLRIARELNELMPAERYVVAAARALTSSGGKAAAVNALGLLIAGLQRLETTGTWGGDLDRSVALEALNEAVRRNPVLKGEIALLITDVLWGRFSCDMPAETWIFDRLGSELNRLGS